MPPELTGVGILAAIVWGVVSLIVGRSKTDTADANLKNAFVELSRSTDKRLQADENEIRTLREEFTRLSKRFTDCIDESEAKDARISALETEVELLKKKSG